MKAAHHFLIITGIATGLVFGQEPPRPPGPPSPPEGSAVPAPTPQRPPNPQRPPSPHADEPHERPDGRRPQREFNPPGDERHHPQGARPLRRGEDPPFPGDPNRARPPRGGEPARPGPVQRESAPPRLPEKLQPYLGVISRNAPPELIAQVRQAEGFGLVIEEVLPESPAQAAGLQRNDLLLRYDDQWLAHPIQLETLVRRTGKDKEATLTILRAGAEQKITFKVGEKMLPERRPGPRPGGPPEQGERPFRPIQGGGPQDSHGSSSAPNEFSRSHAEGSSVRYSVERARVMRRDAQGLYELSQADGAQTFTVKDPSGNVAWSGPVGTPEQRDAMPAEWRDKLKMLENARTPQRRGANAPAGMPVQ